MTFKKRQNYRETTKDQWLPVFRVRRDEQMVKREFLGHENTLYDTVIIYTCHDTFLQTHRIYNSNHEIFGFWMIMTCQCRSCSYNKCTILVGHVDNLRSYDYVRAGGVLKISVLSSQFCCEPKIARKKSFLQLPQILYFLFFKYFLE